MAVRVPGAHSLRGLGVRSVQPAVGDQVGIDDDHTRPCRLNLSTRRWSTGGSLSVKALSPRASLARSTFGAAMSRSRRARISLFKLRSEEHTSELQSRQ